ncbi:helix-turn-helix domain-containing protein [Flavobacterium frigidarium]|uniref:helix-turn-helix domain-containing protein n=1 Tax=Flavobacterium frigidarium TaxID=99286 RepID=UPI000406DBCB|nr:helix-turn-helix domain-containing protein [Flavobacterium frigidarium]
MENAILLHNLTPSDLEELIRKVVAEQLEEFRKNIPIDNPDELLTRAEASSLLKINITTLYNWTKKGQIIAYGIGNRVYYKRGELMGRLIRIN